ncbi:MAG TPA: translocation/assembly module TamB domain-containing protein [Gemmatimonadaceae bacterium]|nr:translocation/assembly module TamB domain-containing protein [Gemmatimonadaceae bacterium]
MRRNMRIGLFVAGVALAVSALVAVFIAQTDPGREIVRRQIVSILNDNSHGVIRVQGLSGNLFSRVRLTGVSITDSTGRPLLLADTIASDYGLRGLIGRRVQLSHLRLVRPYIVIEKFPGQDWNFNRIFPRDTVTREGVRPTGWGTWIRFDDVTVLHGRLIVRVPWEPSSTLTEAEREHAITAALGVDSRMYVTRVRGGFQRVSDFQAIDAHLPVIRLADPAQDFAAIEVERLRAHAYPFRPPGLLVRALTGTFNFTGDSLWWRDTRAELSGSRVVVDGRYTIGNGDLSLRLIGNPVNPADARWVFPELPRTGTGRLVFSMDWIGDSALYVGRNVDLRMEGAHIRGHLGITDTDSVAFHSVTDLSFTGLRTELLERVVGLELPRPGTLAGHARFQGGLNALRVNGDVTYVTRAGTNRLQGDGTVGFPDEDYTFRNLRIRMNPVTADLARTVIPDIPFDGVFTGLAEVNGSTAATVTAVGDVTHVEAGNRSHALGTVAVRPGVVNWFDVNARFAPLALKTVRQFAPALQLRGFVTGPVRATGTVNDFNINTSLAAAGGGNIDVRGRLATGGRAPGYDLTLNAHLFNANAISGRAPLTSLTAVARGQGIGTDFATMRGTFVADVRTSTYDTVGVDSAKVRVALAEGFARVDTLTVHVPDGALDASGTFGLVRGREGELAYRVEIDSLHAFAGLIGGAEGVVAPRPGVLARREAAARADSARIAEDTEIERAATGRAAPTLQVDTPAVVPRDVVAGGLRAEGVARGNIYRASLHGTASGEDIMARGHAAEQFTAEYDLADIGTQAMRLNVNASATTALIAGFEFDTVHTRVDHANSRGRGHLTVRQDDLRVYAADADYVLHADHNEVHLNNLRLQFDTTIWQSVRPSAVQWGGRGVEIEQLELTAGEGRRLYVDGRLPTEGTADLHVVAERFELGDITALLQSDIDARGLVSVDLRARGTMEDPTLEGTAGAEEFSYQGSSLPRVSGTFNYGDETLTGRFDATREDGTTLVYAEGTVPVNLALSGVTGSRIPLDREINLQVHADSFPVGILPQAAEFVTNVTGRTIGAMRIAGTLRRPSIEGEMTIVEGGARIVPLGIQVGSIHGHVRMTGDTIVVDSLAGTSAGGPIGLTGGVGVGSFREPSFDLSLRAQNARLLDNHLGRLNADAELAFYGPFDDARISGGVRIREGILYMPEPDDKNVIGVDDPALFNVVDTAVAADRELFPAQSPLLANLEVDVRVRVERDVFVRSRDANVEVYTDGDLILYADRAREILTLDGILLSDRGDYTFMQKRFRIRRGAATFVGLSEINPTLQVAGEYEVRLPAREALMIQIIIGGTLQSPRIELRSSAQPPLSQTDLLSYLAFGRSSSSLTQLEGASLTSGSAGGTLIGQGAALAVQQLATVAVGMVTDEFAGEAARSLGADVFIITPADVQTDIGNFLRSTEVEFGKYVRPATFMALQARPDPQSLRRPGFSLEHRFQRLQGYQFRLNLGPRYILFEPTLAEREPKTRSVFGAFVIREWRY